MSEPDADAFARFVFDDAPQPGYTSLPPLTLDEMTALLAGIESHKQRLVVPVERVEEFETAVRTARLDDRVTVVGHPWLKPDQAFLMQSEAAFEADMRATIEADLRTNLDEYTEAFGAQLRAKLLAEAEAERIYGQFRPLPRRSPFRGPFDDGGVDG